MLDDVELARLQAQILAHRLQGQSLLALVDFENSVSLHLCVDNEVLFV
jgi:hypothetical protein